MAENDNNTERGTGNEEVKGNPGEGENKEGAPAAESGTEGKPEPDKPAAAESAPLTDEILFAEIGKRYGDKGIKSREDLERIVSADYSNHIVPKNDLVKKLNDWAGDLETFTKLSKLDVDAMDNKAAIIEDMIIKEGLSSELAEIKFNRKYGHAFKESTDEGYDADEKALASHDLMKDAKSAKESLGQWKASEQDKGTNRVDPEAEAKAAQQYDEQWLKPIKSAIEGLQKIDLNVKYELPDKTMVEEPFSFGVEQSESKKIAEDILSSKSTDELLTKLVQRYGVGPDGKTANHKGLVDLIMFYENRNEIIQHAMSVGASKGLENHLKNVKPGDLANEKRDGENQRRTPSNEQNVIDAMNKAMTK